ncbi:REST corepressor isoform X2 [Drosophila innubila]|uniref:REST corepressor isoform X2 n=1 Tax=Drosophila innubila TaxID=198719 RepID=UPI00148CBB93|nr:REST corepressor isoform X2 [Drosophila innubila]
MVLAERNTGDVVRNGRRSRGPSPNTHTSGAGGGGGAANAHNAGSGIGGGGGGGGGGGNSTNATVNEKANAAPGAGTPESSDDDNSTKRNGKSKTKQSEYEEKIRVGRDYQAVCPQLVPELDRRPELMNERALLVWSPTKEIPDMKLEEYISVAKEKYGYNGEQALGMLFWHKHDLERAVMDLANFTPFPDEWTTEDKVLFEQAFQFHGKSFHRIRQMLPDKSIASLVKYYYSWKKTRHRSSAMDRQEKMIKAAVKDGSENGSEVGSNEESDNDDKRANNNNSTMNNNNNSNNSNSNTSNSSSHNAGTQTTTQQASNGNNNNNSNSNSTGDTGNNGGGGSSSSGVGSGSGSGVGSSSNNSNSNNNNDLDSDQLCIYTNAIGEDMLGFGLPGFGLSIDNGADSADIDKSNGNTAAGAAATGTGGNARRVVVGGFCKNCNVVCYILFDSPLGRMCKSCHAHWRRTGNRRPISGPESFQLTKRSTHNNAAAAAADRSKRKPPRGMYINHDDLISLAGCKNPCEYLAEGDRKIAALLADIQKNRQMMEQLEKDCSGHVQEESAPKATTPTEGAAATAAAATGAGTGSGNGTAAGTGNGAAGAGTATATAAGGAAAVTPPAQPPRTTARWTADEIQVALLALRDYGKNFPMIAKVVGTKTEAHVRTFYVSNRRRFNLDQIVKEYEATVKADEEENNDAAAATAAAAAAATGNSVGDVTAGSGSGSGSGSVKAAANDASEVNSQELLAKKEETASTTTTITTSTKKKPELMNATVAPTALKSSDSGAGATTGAGTAASVPSAPTAAAAAANNNNSNNKSIAPTITIVDESDTATSSSSDVTNSNSNSNTALTATTATTASTTATTTTTATNNHHNDADSMESTSLKSTNHAVAKRDNSDMNTAELPPAKKMALTVSAEFLAK